MATYPDITVLASGRIAYVHADGHATLETCTWLVEVPTASLRGPDWYPDSPADVYTAVNCDAPLYAVGGDVDHTRCANGHEHLTYGSPAQQRQEAMEAMVELAAASNPSVAARLDAGETWQEVMAS